MYRNIVFDLGGVVVNYDPQDFLVELFFHERLERQVYDFVFGSKEWAKLDCGEISWREAVDIFMRRAREHDIELEMREVVDTWTDMLTTRKSTVALLRLLKKKGFNLYYLTNISAETLEMMQNREFWPLFDGGVASCEVGVQKPELGIYKALLEKYNLSPQETIFADDRKENAQAAFLAGITGIQFKNVKSFCKLLVTYGINI